MSRLSINHYAPIPRQLRTNSLTRRSRPPAQHSSDSLPASSIQYHGVPQAFERENKVSLRPEDVSQDVYSIASGTSSGTDLRSRLSPVNSMTRARDRIESPITSPRISWNGDDTPQHYYGNYDQDRLEQLIAQQQRLAELRSNIIRHRVELHDHRNLYRNQRSRARDVDARYQRAIRAHGRDPANENNLLALQKALQDLESYRDYLGPLEERYDELETHLDRMDFNFSRGEELFMKQLEEFLHGLRGPAIREVPSELPTPTPMPNIAPLVMEYYSRVGDITLLEDRIRDLSIDFEINTKYSESEIPPGELPSKTRVGDLNEFHQEWETLRQQLHTARMEADELLRRCHNQGLQPDPRAIAQASEILAAAEDLRYGNYPTLFRFPYGKSTNPAQLLSDFENTRDRINRWLLDNLRISEIEARRHRSFLPRDLAQIEDQQWARLVWKYWPRDEFATAHPLSLASSSGAESTRSGVDYSGFLRELEMEWERTPSRTPRKHFGLSRLAKARPHSM
jgi:hypothetical protein